MALQMFPQLMSVIGELRYEPTPKRLRALAGDVVVADSTGALIVWEPRRVVPSYAVPVTDVRAELVAAPAPGLDARPVRLRADAPDVYDPSTAFAVHTTPGENLTVRVEGAERPDAAFRPADPDLAGYVVLDFDAFRWLEEDEEVVSHPRDPFHRVDVRRSTRHVRIERDGQVLAESERPSLVFETSLPVRTYLPREDVRLDLLEPSPHRTACAYKGEAAYLSFGAVRDLAWTYERPLPDAVQLTGLVAFFDERVDVTVDGEPRPRPVTPWS